jgi:hypothetical protein
MVLPAQLSDRWRQKLESLLAEAREGQQWFVRGYPQTDENGQVRLCVKALMPPEEEVVNWVRLQGQVKGRDEATGRLFMHLRRNRKDREGNRPAWIMTVLGRVAQPGRYQLVCTIEAGALVLVEGELLPDRQRRADAVPKQESTASQSKDTAIQAG